MSRDVWISTPEQIILLRRNLTDYFSDDELRALCSEMGVDYSRLRGNAKAIKASELVRYLAARGRIPELVRRASRLRPDVSWGMMPEDLAARTSSPQERSTPVKAVGPAFQRVSWLVAALIVVAGLAFVLGGRLRLGRPGTAPRPAIVTPSPAPMITTPAAPTPTPAVAGITATPAWTPTPPIETAPTMIETLEQTSTSTPTRTLTETPTPLAVARVSVPRVVSLTAPLNGSCIKFPLITFKWTGAALRPGESFLVAIVPSQVHKGLCSKNNTAGVQYSPSLTAHEWTTDISIPPQVPRACAGMVEWTVYIQSPAGNVAQAAPIQYFEWNPLGCGK